ncbi:MAG: type IV fimbrial biogenesis protein FimT [Colwellia sp.]|jgi:type IV fimbrial biogenesis protein FimT
MKYDYLQSNNRRQGFTLVELMITIAIGATLMAIALPKFNSFLVETRVDNEISHLQRLLLTARNTAINAEQSVTLCPLNASNRCDTNWQNEVSVFIDIDGDKTYEPASDERIVAVKAKIKTNDKLQYGQDSIIYRPTGNIMGGVSASPFKYCPKDYPAKSRGITVTTSGRSYVTSDTDSDGIDEDRSGNEITCS